VDRLAGLRVPENRRLALVRDAECRELVGRDVCPVECLDEHLLRIRPEFERVVFDPARLWIQLLVSPVGGRNCLSAVVEQQTAGPRRSLVDSAHVLCHALSPSPGVCHHSIKLVVPMTAVHRSARQC
jgi:hypothetical protein